MICRGNDAFEDKNIDDKYDSNVDELLVNKNVYLLDEDGSVIRSTFTDSEGKYEFRWKE